MFVLHLIFLDRPLENVDLCSRGNGPIRGRDPRVPIPDDSLEAPITSDTIPLSIISILTGKRPEDCPPPPLDDDPMSEMGIQLHARQRRVRREVENLTAISNHFSHQLEENTRNKKYVDGETAHHMLEATLLARDFLGSDSSSDRTTRSSLASQPSPAEPDLAVPTDVGRTVSEVSDCTMASMRPYCPGRNFAYSWVSGLDLLWTFIISLV